MKRWIFLASLLAVCLMNAAAQNPGGSSATKQFDELWEKAQKGKTGNVTKDLNALEREKIETLDLKNKYTNPGGKVDTSNLEIFSTKPVIKGSTPAVKPATTPAAVADTVKATKKPDIKTTPVKVEKDKTPPQLVKDSVKTKEAKVKETVKSPATLSKQPKDEDFSTKPVIKGAKSAPSAAETTTTPVKPAFKIDTTKSLKDFTFETTPVINKNASYTRKDEPLPKSKEQIEDEIPVNKTIVNRSPDPYAKEVYAQYNKEADSIHLANKRRLDSIMRSLNIKVPVVINPADYIDIFLSGGGLISDNNSKLYDRISILNSGVVQREYKTKQEGVQRMEKKISRDELTKLAQYIVDLEFLDFAADYDCADGDADCEKRLSSEPQAVPLTLSLTVGQKKNKIEVALFAPKSEKNWVNYPPALEKIVNAIYAIVVK